MSFSEIHLDIPGVRLAARVHGPSSGRRVLALHGWLDNAATFERLAPLLPELRIVALDLAGHGLSEHRHASASYHFIDWVPDVVAAADALGWERFVLMGHSMGGAIASLTSGTVPERVEALVMLDGVAPYTTPPERVPETLATYLRQRTRLLDKTRPDYPSREAALAKLLKVAPELGEAAARILVARGTREVEGGVRWTYDARLRRMSPMRFSNEHVVAFLRRIIAPSLLVRPSRGLPLDPAVLDALTAAWKQLEIVRLEGGHHVHLDAAELVAPAVRAFLERARG